MTIESTASKVPVFSLPQTELLTLNVNDVPMTSRMPWGLGSTFSHCSSTPRSASGRYSAPSLPGCFCPSICTPVVCTDTR